MISIIIVNWNSNELLKECIESINNYSDSLVDKVIVVDNYSTDNSLSALKKIENLTIDLQIIYNQENLGFGKACNQGAMLCNSKYLLFLNPDTRLYEDTLKESVEFMEKPANYEVGVCGIQLIDERKEIQRSCTRFPSPISMIVYSLGLNRFPFLVNRSYQMLEWDHKKSQKVDHVIGAFYFIRNDIFRQVGGFDEDYFVYLEDLDLSLRINKLGYRSYYNADIKAYHKGGGTSERVKAKRLFYSLESRIKYSKKHFSPISSGLVIVSTLALEPFIRIGENIFSGSKENLLNTLKAYKMLYKYLLTKKS